MFSTSDFLQQWFTLSHNKCTHDLLWCQAVWVAITIRTIRKNWVIYKILFMPSNLAHLQATMTHLDSHLQIQFVIVLSRLLFYKILILQVLFVYLNLLWRMWLLERVVMAKNMDIYKMKEGYYWVAKKYLVDTAIFWFLIILSVYCEWLQSLSAKFTYFTDTNCTLSWILKIGNCRNM